MWKNKVNNLLEKEKSMNNLLNIYKKHKNLLLKKYFDKWLSNIKEKDKDKENDPEPEQENGMLL